MPSLLCCMHKCAQNKSGFGDARISPPSVAAGIYNINKPRGKTPTFSCKQQTKSSHAH